MPAAAPAAPRAAAGEYLARLAGSLDQQRLDIETHAEWARTAREIPAAIARSAAAQNGELIVMCAGLRHGWTKRLFPSVAEQVVAAGSTPVRLTPAEHLLPGLEAGPDGTSILVPLDGSAAAETALTHATELARSVHARLVLLYAVSPLAVSDAAFYTHRLVDNVLSLQCDEGRSYLALVGGQLKQEGLVVRTRVRVGTPVQVILEELKEHTSAMVVTAADHLTRLQRAVIGSAADQLLWDGSCPVVLVNGDREITPLSGPRAGRIVAKESNVESGAAGQVRRTLNVI